LKMDAKWNFKSIPVGYIKMTSMDGIKFILTFIFEERGCWEYKHMCGFFCCEIILPVYFLLMVCSMNVDNRMFLLRKFKDINFKY
jgi:hypothetical protein